MFIFFSWCWGKIFLCGPRLDEAQLKVQLKQCVAPSFELVLGTQLRSESQGRKGGCLVCRFLGLQKHQCRKIGKGCSWHLLTLLLHPTNTQCLGDCFIGADVFLVSDKHGGDDPCNTACPTAWWGLQSGGNRARGSSGRTIFGPYLPHLTTNGWWEPGNRFQMRGFWHSFFATWRLDHIDPGGLPKSNKAMERLEKQVTGALQSMSKEPQRFFCWWIEMC